jgi:hypothetical protein
MAGGKNISAGRKSYVRPEVTNKISIEGTQKSWKESYVYWSLLLFMNCYIKVLGLCLFIIF